jgi:hypothetical protein
MGRGRDYAVWRSQAAGIPGEGMYPVDTLYALIRRFQRHLLPTGEGRQGRGG